MKLRELAAGLDIYGKGDPCITELAYDSRMVKKGALFFAVKGRKFDGHTYIKDAVKNGAVALVVEKIDDSIDIPMVRVNNTRKAMEELSAKFYKNPSQKLKVIGVTGTNGKTTVTFITRDLLNCAGFKTGLAGTIIYDYIKSVVKAERTTPESIDIQKILSEVYKNGGKCAVIEASSAGLKEGRLNNVTFWAGVFTNFTREHMEYHKTMDDYFNSKKLLFTKFSPSFGIFNNDDNTSSKLMEAFAGEKITYSVFQKSDIKGNVVSFDINGSVIEVNEQRFHIPYIGLYNVYNFLASLAVFKAMGISFSLVNTKCLSEIPGRMERVICSKKNGHGFNVFVDFAHTPFAMKSVLTAIKPITTGRLIAVFGAGGDRDKGKRPLMGEAVSSIADMVFVTSDNPRSESPLSIIQDILKGVKGNENVQIQPDRRIAIEQAIKSAREGDVVMILGKGHETYQEINGIFYPFDDRQVAKEFLCNTH